MRISLPARSEDRRYFTEWDGRAWLIRPSRLTLTGCRMALRATPWYCPRAVAATCVPAVITVM